MDGWMEGRKEGREGGREGGREKGRKGGRKGKEGRFDRSIDGWMEERTNELMNKRTNQ
ncbi:hypothetical protein DPMN_189202 [Dreissena polymorpha]|uniref:Uncharacterized protein n=1 Tax=Dreissena polymorpha TaxID=45954 RepID=A0A9D4IC07_DREPO|nr:hypothetical protein DPMN_189202 [Dreissena polymorpha]